VERDLRAALDVRPLGGLERGPGPARPEVALHHGPTPAGIKDNALHLAAGADLSILSG